MGVIHREAGFRFMIFTDDHEPAHVHIFGDGEMKINLIGVDGLPVFVASVGFKRSDRRKALRIVGEHQLEFLKCWEALHGKAEQDGA
jgi:hypothetical protein